MNKEELILLSTLDKDNYYTEFKNVNINQDLDITDRLEKFFEQIVNPYLLKSEKLNIKISFQSTNLTLDDALGRFLITKMLGDND